MTGKMDGAGEDHGYKAGVKTEDGDLVGCLATCRHTLAVKTGKRVHANDRRSGWVSRVGGTEKLGRVEQWEKIA